MAYAFNAPTLWNIDFRLQMYGAIFMMAGAYTLCTEAHVRGDVIYRLFKPRTQGWIDLVLFIILMATNYMTRARFFPGTLLGLFLLGYGIFRSFVELFREPDSHIGFIFNNITMGQILSVPMIFIGILFLYMASNNKNRKF